LKRLFRLRRALGVFPRRVPLLVVESSLFSEILQRIEILERTNEGDKEDGGEDGRLAQERVVQVNEASTARGVDEVREGIANHRGATVRLFSLREVETAHPDVPRHNGRVEKTIFIIHSRGILQHLTVHDFGVDNSVPVDFAFRILELFKIPVAVHPSWILPRRLFASEDRTSHGSGARSLAESLVTLERTAGFERSSLASFSGGRGDDTSADTDEKNDKSQPSVFSLRFIIRGTK
jgi:hypothetical protein